MLFRSGQVQPHPPVGVPPPPVVLNDDGRSPQRAHRRHYYSCSRHNAYYIYFVVVANPCVATPCVLKTGLGVRNAQLSVSALRREAWAPKPKTRQGWKAHWAGASLATACPTLAVTVPTPRHRPRRHPAHPFGCVRPCPLHPGPRPLLWHQPAKVHPAGTLPSLICPCRTTPTTCPG